jgi:hypothetical protein
MNRFLNLTLLGMLLAICGCSRNHQTTVSASAQPTPGASSSQATAPDEPSAPLPVPTGGHLSLQPWRPEPIDDHMGGATVLKRTSLDGKYDLVILEKGSTPFLSFVEHARWEFVHSLAAKAKVMELRLTFEDGHEKHVKWNELGFGSDNLYAVLWSYPAQSGSIGGDQILMQEMLSHRAMVLEIQPGVNAQFDLTGLATEMARIHPLHRPESILEARQATQQIP